MPSMVDTGYLDALAQIYGQRNAAIQGLSNAVAGTAASIGGDIIKRNREIEAKKAELDDYRKALLGEGENLSALAFDLAPTRDMGQYETAERQAKLTEIGQRQQDIQTAIGQLDQIGQIDKRNYRTAKAPKLAERGSVSYAGAWKDLEARRRADQDQAEAEAAERRAADVERRHQETLGVQRMGLGIKAKQADKKDDGAQLTAGETTPIATNLNTIKGTLEHIQLGAANRDKFGRVSGTGEKVTSAISGKGFGQTMAKQAKRLGVSQARVRTQGNPTESDMAAAVDVAGDISLEYDQWLQQQLDVLDEAISQTELQVDLTRDGNQKRTMQNELAKYKAERAKLSQQPTAGRAPISDFQ